MHHKTPYARRVFLAHIALCAGGLACAAGPPPKRNAPRLRGVRLETGAKISDVRAFYAERLGFPVIDETATSIAFAAGQSTLAFDHAPGSTAHYHFAFNIPENQILAAHDWQRERTPLIPPPDRLTDPGMPRDVVSFRHWNAHSVFFEDPAGNVVEHIARHELSNSSSEPFTSKSVLYLSEIGLVVDDVPAEANRVKRALELGAYISASERFEAIGDAGGLLLMMKTGRPMVFERGRARGVHPTKIDLSSASKTMTFDSYPYELRTR